MDRLGSPDGCEVMMIAHQCRACGAQLGDAFLDLGPTPLANSYLRREDLDHPEPFYPLSVYVCDECFLVQIPVAESPSKIFSEYAYFSSYSSTWLSHAAQFAHRMADQLRLDSSSLVIEIASNDGYLLRFFREQAVPVLGIEPARNVAVAAQAAGIPTIVEFFGSAVAQHLVETRQQADLVIANNVLAHVPELDDFVAGLKRVLKPAGLLTMEFPHLLRLMAENQFDTIYHEHLSYLSLGVVKSVLERHTLSIVDVEELPTHGGSLRVHARHRQGEASEPAPRVEALIRDEQTSGLTRRERYDAFAEQVRETKRALLDFLISVKRKGHSIVGYGAPAKGNTLLNYCGIRRDFLDYTVDRSPHKQGLFLPGTRVPVHAPERIMETKPDYLLILPWNLKAEIVEQMREIRSWGGQFVVPIPHVEVC